jgi:N-acetyl-anhydromuramyl-L-alanine amidase AmpD
MIKLTTNFTKGTIPKIGFVIHGTLGNYDGAVDWLYQPCANRNPVTYSSAHYVIAKDGRMTQLVENSNVAWHAGTVSNPTPEAAKLLPKTILGTYKNPNESFIGIELEWFAGDAITEAQYSEIVKIINTSGIKDPILLCHTQITDYKADFGNKSNDIILNIKSRLQPKQASREEIKAQIISLINQL